MNNSYIASEIKSRVKMPELLRCYGIDIDRKNRIVCPLHSGTDRNCGVKDDYIHCFVCNESADQIGFVQKYFSLSFPDAVSKINADFSLGLPIGEQIDKRQQIEASKEAFLRKQKRKEFESKKTALFDEIVDLKEKCAQIIDEVRCAKINKFDFEEACKNAQKLANIEHIKYIIEEKERELNQLENTNTIYS